MTRTFTRRTALAAASAATETFAPGPNAAIAQSAETFGIKFISPESGPLSWVGVMDAYVLQQAGSTLKNGVVTHLDRSTVAGRGGR